MKEFVPAHDPVFEARLHNLRSLISQWGGPTVLAERVGWNETSSLSQMTGPNPTRTISEKTARRIEKALNLAHGWLDVEHNGEPANAPMTAYVAVGVAAAVAQVQRLCDESMVKLTPLKQGEVTQMVYDLVLKGDVPDDNWVRKLITLAK